MITRTDPMILDPVSEKEIKRADAVSDFQHNRNPFIDYPYLAEYIWGEKAGQALDLSHLISSTDPRFVIGISNGWIDNPSGIDSVTDESTSTTAPAKVFVDGKLFIVVGNSRYTITGQKVN